MNVYNSPDFVFSVPYEFTDRFAGQKDFFSSDMKPGEQEDRVVNFIPDLTAVTLDPRPERGEAAGDADAVLRYAPAAAARAASLGAYREAAAQYARALRFGDRLSVAERAELLERRSQACNLTDQRDAAVEAIQDALACRRHAECAPLRPRRGRV